MRINNKRFERNRISRLVLFVSFAFMLLFFNLLIVSAEDGVYISQPNKEGLLRPVLFPFVNGEINIPADKYSTVYLEKSADGKDGKNPIGIMKGVKLKKDGNNILIEFQEGGSLSRSNLDTSVDPEFLHLDYDNIKAGGKLVVDSKSELVSADFETTKPGNYYLNGFIYEVPAGTKMELAGEIVNLKLNQGGGFTYYSVKEPDKKKTYEHIKNGGEFRIDKKGELIKAKFEVNAETDLSLKGYKYKLAKDSKVDFDNSNVGIIVPDGTILSAPEKIAGETADLNLVFSFSTESGKGINLPSGDIIENKDGKTVVNYKDGFYISDKKYLLKTSDGKEDLLISTNGKSTYLYFQGNSIDETKSYVYVGSDKIVSSSPAGSGEGASLFLIPGNRLGIRTTTDNTIAVESKNGKAIVEKPVGDNVPAIKLSGESIVTLDKRSFYGQGSDLYFDPKKVLAGDFNNGKYSASAKVSFVGDNGNNLKNFDIYSNDKDQYAAASDKDLKSPFKYFKTGGGFYVSSSLTFNQLSYDAQKFYDSLDAKRQQEIAGFANNGEKAGSADLQMLIKKLIDEEIKIRQNPVKASFRMYVPGSGGSGTIIGVDKEGYPIAITAGHIATRAGTSATLQFSDGSKLSGTVIGGEYNQNERDYCIIRVNTKIPGIAYVPVASADRDIKVGDTVMRIGTPNLGAFRYTSSVISTVGGSGRMLGTQDRIGGPIPGESGGGLFSNGRLVGIVSVTNYKGWGGYAPTSVIREALTRYGYGNLISSFVIFRNVLIR